MKENQFNSYSFLSPLYPFTTPTIFPTPVTLVSCSPPHGGRFFPQSSPSTFSSPSTSRRNKCAPTRIFKKAVSYPRSAHLHHLHHLRLPTLARATASPSNTVVSRHSRAFSSSFFSASFPVPFLLFSHPYIFFIPSAKLRLPSKSLHTFPSLSLRFLFLFCCSPSFFCYSSLRNCLRFHAFTFFPSRWLYSLLFLVILIWRYILCTPAEDERVWRTDLASEGKDVKKDRLCGSINTNSKRRFENFYRYLAVTNNTG